MLKEAFGDDALGRAQTYELFKCFKNGCVSVNDEERSWRPLTWTTMKMWQKFDTEGIVHKEFVPSGQTVKGKFYCHVLRRMRENIQRKCPDNWRNNSWALNHDNALAHTSLVAQQFLAPTNKTVIPPTLPTHWTSPPVISPIPEDEIATQGATLTALKRSRPNCRM